MNPPAHALIDDHPELARALEAAHITGRVATPRESNLSHIHRFLAAERQFDFGVTLLRRWTYEQVFEVMVQRCGINPDPEYRSGADTISTAACIERSAALGEVVREVATAGGLILFATGHPSAMSAVHRATRQWAVSLGARTVAQTEYIPAIGVGGDVRDIDGVWMWHQHGGVPHTHFAEPGEAVLDYCLRTGIGKPDLVVADHGWAGGLASAGLRTVGYADCNDPALFVAEAQDQVEVCVPLDDNVPPYLYAPLIEFITGSR